MDYTGLYIRYPIHRALTQQERSLQLHQKVRLEAEPSDQLSVIRLNATYLELVDKYFAWKGFMSGALLACIGLFGGGWLAMLGSYWLGGDMAHLDAGAFLLSFALMGLLAMPAVGAFIWLLRKESFAYTHYPVRFNRKTRMVHVFRVDGTVLSAPWDAVFFCLGALRQGNWEIQGHVLDRDGVTVRDTFCAFPQIAGNTAEREQLKCHWEFIRRYMEDGPEDAYQRTRICLPTADRRELVSFGFQRMHVEGAGNLVTQLLAAGLAIFTLPGRWFAMRSSKIPQWPAHVESVNRLERDDPFVRDASMNEKWQGWPDAVWLALSAVIWGAVIYSASTVASWH